MGKAPTLRATVDRILVDEAGNTVAILVLDDGQQMAIHVRVLPPGIAEKQVLSLRFKLDTEETRRRIGEVERLQRDLFGE